MVLLAEMDGIRWLAMEKHDSYGSGVCSRNVKEYFCRSMLANAEMNGVDSIVIPSRSADPKDPKEREKQ